MAQIQELGTKWMLEPNGRVYPPSAYTDYPIEEMDFQDAKRMMCAKSMGNPMKCQSCSGFEKCRAGKRVTELMVEANKQLQEAQEKGKPELFKSIMKDQEILEEACKSGNATQWIMDHYGTNKNKAVGILERLCKECINVAAEYGGDRRIIQKPKDVKIESIAAEKKQEVTVAEEEEQEETEENKYVKGEDPREKAKRIRLENQREICRWAIRSGDPVKYLTDRGRKEVNARKKVIEWMKKFPDICDGFVLQPKERGPNKKKAKEEKKNAQEGQKALEMEEDEISVEDFLKGLEPIEQSVEATEEKTEDTIQSETGDPMLAGMEAKYRELDEEQTRLMEQIKKIEEQQEALRRCIDVFKRGR